MENLFIIGWGLGGSFGGIRNYEVTKADDLDMASEEAWDLACQEYESYCGSNGLREVGEIMDEEEVDEDEATAIYEEEREGWIDYLAIPYTREDEKRLSGHHFYNNYKELTDKL